MKSDQEIKRELGARILQTMKASKDCNSRNALAKELGISQPTVSRIISGINEAGIITIFKIAKFYGVSVDYLLGTGQQTVPSIDYDMCQREVKKLKTKIKHIRAIARDS